MSRHLYEDNQAGRGAGGETAADFEVQFLDILRNAGDLDASNDPTASHLSGLAE
jgi:hypothetical protein